MVLNLDFYRGKSVLVTGHTGFKGIWLCRMLELLGANVTGYALLSPTEEGKRFSAVWHRNWHEFYYWRCAGFGCFAEGFC